MKRDVLGGDKFLIPVAKSFLNANIMCVLPWQLASHLIDIGNKVQAVSATNSELKKTC